MAGTTDPGRLTDLLAQITDPVPLQTIIRLLVAGHPEADLAMLVAWDPERQDTDITALPGTRTDVETADLPDEQPAIRMDDLEIDQTLTMSPVPGQGELMSAINSLAAVACDEGITSLRGNLADSINRVASRCMQLAMDPIGQNLVSICNELVSLQHDTIGYPRRALQDAGLQSIMNDVAFATVNMSTDDRQAADLVAILNPQQGRRAIAG